MKAILVGDVHSKADELADVEALHQLILATIFEHHPDCVIYLGDQYHTHAIVNVEVQRAWLRMFAELSGKVDRIFAIVGNHDKPGDQNAIAHSMQVHGDIVRVDSLVIYEGLVMLPHFHDKNKLIDAAMSAPNCNTLLCHQTFNGAQYENGFHAKESISADAVPQQAIISGHIHTPTTFGKVWYPGSPRWHIISDANVERAIWVVEFANGLPIKKTPIFTAPYLRAIWQITDQPDSKTSVEELINKTVKSGDKVVVNLQGPRAWCEQRKAALMAFRAGIRYRAFPTDTRQAKVKESDGIAVAFKKHFERYRPLNSTPTNVLSKMVEERVHV